MRKLALLPISAAALFVTAGAASAQYYSGPGFGVQIAPRYEDGRYRYNDDRRYDRRYQRRTYNGCRYGYTVQDGRCKPYTGR